MNHRAYGKLTAALDVRSRRDVARFMDDIRSESLRLCAP
ncbi:MAG: 3H domain-containing protein [Slackia sp.]